MTTTITQRVSIRNMNRTDYEIMAQWLSTPEVLEFYGNVNSPFTREKVKQKYEPRINGEVSVYPYIVELDKTPIGYMQYYKLAAETQKEFGYPLNLNIHGIDQFIGVPEYFNQGIGTIMVTKFVIGLYRNPNLNLIVLDPEVSNERAIRCYEKVGFVKVKKVHDETSWLMELKTRGIVYEAVKSGNE